MKKQSRILFTSVSYSALMLTLSFSPSVADITINAGGTSGTNLEINSVDVSEASSEQKAVGTTWVDEGDGSGLTQTDIKESLGAYYLNVEEDQKTYTGNIVVTDGANVTIAPYDIKVQGGAEDEGTPGTEDAVQYDFSKNALFVLNGTSSIYSQNGGRITIAPMRADEDSSVQGGRRHNIGRQCVAVGARGEGRVNVFIFDGTTDRYGRNVYSVRKFKIRRFLRCRKKFQRYGRDGSD